MGNNRRIAALSTALRTSATTARQLVEEALERIDDPSGEGARSFMKVWHDRARDLADHIDGHALWRDASLPLCGIPISVKDAFDIAGEITQAGSIARDGEPSAQTDAKAVRRLRAAGAILIGRTTMSEFAFSGIGLNRNFGTPRNPWDRVRGRIPGGSSSGSAVAVADAMCAGSLATDTGGSIRAPAALCGVSGFKPSFSSSLLNGVFPRSYSLDTVGPIALSVSCCAMINAALGDPDATRISLSPPLPLKGLRIAIIDGEPLQDLAPEVAQAFSAALTQLSEKGALLSHISLSEIVDIRDLNARGGISPAEAFSIHRNLIASHPERIDPIFLARLRKGGSVSAADYIDALRQRQAITEAVRTKIQAYDAIAMPTCPVVAPLIAEVETPQAFEAMSALILRNCNLANFLDLPALTIPIQLADSAPVGMMLIGHNQRDYALLQIGVAVENALAASRL